jgi:hypothetical protein
MTVLSSTDDIFLVVNASVPDEGYVWDKIYIQAIAQYNKYPDSDPTKTNYDLVSYIPATTETTKTQWDIPLPYNRNAGFAFKPPGSVTITAINKEGNVLPLSSFPVLLGRLKDNNPTTSRLITQNLTPIGPAAVFMPPSQTQWVFETSSSLNVQKLDIKKNKTTNVYTVTPGEEGSSALFGIPLYNLGSIQNTSYRHTFSVTNLSAKPTVTTSDVTLDVFPVVYVTSLDSKLEQPISPDLATNTYNHMYQLSISGNPTGAGVQTDWDEYSDQYIAPSLFPKTLGLTMAGQAGTGQTYMSGLFDYKELFDRKVLWQSMFSPDCVFCSGGVLNMAPYTFFYNYHPWDWDLKNVSPTNGYVAYTYPDMQIYTTGDTPTLAHVPRMKLVWISGTGGTITEEGTTIIQDYVQIASTNIVYGAQVRGGSNSPSALFWSLNTLVKCSYVGSTVQFQFDTIANNISILSSKSVVEVSGVFYWIGIDQFYVFNGVVETLPNDYNINFFFRNVDIDNAQKIWASKIGQYNEICWHWPNKNLPNYTGECNAILVFNYTPGAECWYDSSFPVLNNSSSAGRICGSSISTFPFPIWMDSYSQPDPFPNTTETGNYWYMWLHERTRDMVIPGLQGTYDSTTFLLADNRYLIPSSISSREISLPAVGPDNNWSGVDKWLKLKRIEPDFLQTADIQLKILARKYSKDYFTELPNSFLIHADDPFGVCLKQIVDYYIGVQSYQLIIDGNYSVSQQVAKFPYPRLITVTNYTYFYYSAPVQVPFNITILGTYKDKVQTETLFVNYNTDLKTFATATSTLLYNEVASITLTPVFSPGPPDKVFPYLLSVGTKIPYGTEVGSVESERLMNFYTDVNVHARKLILQINQNLQGGSFELGQFLLYFDVGDGRQ